MNEMAHDDSLVGNSENRIHTTFARADFTIIRISGEEQWSLMQINEKSAVGTTQREEVKSMSRNLVEEIVCDESITG